MRVTLLFLLVSACIAPSAASLLDSQRKRKVECAEVPDSELSKVHLMERSYLRLAGGLQLFIRTYAGAMNDLETFLATYEMWWPRHLAKTNLTIVLDADNVKDAASGKQLSRRHPCLKVAYTDELQYAPFGFDPNVLWPGLMAERLKPLYKRRANSADSRNRGYDRQQWHWFHLDMESTAGMLAFFDADTIIDAPVTFSSLFSVAHAKTYEGGHHRMLQPLVKQRYFRRFQNGCSAMLGSETCKPFGMESMAYFPVIVHRSSLAHLRSYVVKYNNASSFAEVSRTLMVKFVIPLPWSLICAIRDNLYLESSRSLLEWPRASSSVSSTSHSLSLLDTR